ncbi:MAG: TetR/AcrR family transcriptional regulator [Anaerolineales bacterium]|nr:TetR/AcrR family transcriptional regulator [Anaerolineales bacterium]
MEEVIPRRGERTRLEIIQAAHDLFVRQGYHGTSIRQIARSANIALGGLYNHFAGKEEVFQAVFLEYHPYREVLPLLMDAQGQTIEELLRDAAERMVTTVKGRPDFLNLMFIELVEFKSIHTQDLFQQLFPFGMQILANIKVRGQGQLRPIPEPMIIRSFLGLFFSYYLTELILASAGPAEFHHNAMQYLVDIYLHGILAASDSPPTPASTAAAS